jgi:mannose-6-phosphate isomerase
VTGPVPPLVRLGGPVRPYAWGSHRFLAELTGRPAPSDEPEAEQWFGDHPTAPSWAIADDGSSVGLDVLLASDPGAWLGATDDDGARLPFLVKLLAAATPLSLQAHPSAAQARAGYAREEAAGLPRDARDRSYPDPWAKPELLLALTPVDALCGFRAADGLRALVVALDVPGLAWVGDAAERPAAALERLLCAPSDPELIAAVGAAGRRLATAGHRFAPDGGWLATLARRYPTDPGVLVAVLLQLVRLRPGQAVHVPAGRLHAYLHGAGVEVMGPSDNVLRGGLTPKHVDVEELLRVLERGDGSAGPLVGCRPGVPGERVRPTPSDAFRASELWPAGGEVVLDRRGPDLIVALRDGVEVVADGHRCRLEPGRAALVAASASQVVVRGRGSAVRATPGDR